jgi:hypothetical protein
MGYDSTILIKIDKKTKRRMDNLDVNWSGRIRDFIHRELTRKARWKQAERIRKSLFRESHGLESVEVIRRMRASRHGAGSD